MRATSDQKLAQIITSVLVITLASVSLSQCSSVQTLGAAPATEPVQPVQPVQPSDGARSAQELPVAGRIATPAGQEAVEPVKQVATPAAEPKLTPESAANPDQVSAKSDLADAKQVEASEPVRSDSEPTKRRGRSDEEPSKASAPAADSKTSVAAEKPSEKATTAVKSEPSAAAAAAAKSTSTSTSTSSAASTPSVSKSTKTQLSGKSGSGSAGKSKLPPNLGTVTSTGSGGASGGGHYMSKHDAYSAIAEKHGALAHDAMRKSDKRNLQSFGGIQKASGFGDMLSPFKGVSDSGLARTLGASMRSIMKGKYSVPAYVASALLGAVALMAFYESPISPLPVPPLPEPPIGRFPPEIANLPIGTQIPFRGSQQAQQLQGGIGGSGGYSGQYNYNSRSFQQPAQMPQQQQQQQQQYQQQPGANQVLFPGSNSGMQPAEQRQASNPMGQLAANLLSVGKQQVAQRKSGPDYDPSSSRSIFGSATPTIAAKLSAPLNQQKGQGSGILSFLGLSAPDATAGAQQTVGQLLGSSSAPSNGASPTDPKSQASSLSNSHLVNKVKSYFSRSPVAPSSSSSSSIASASSNPYEQYQRMSFVQALIKDTQFLPAFLSPTRKSSSASPASSGSSGAASKLQSLTSALSSAANSGSSSQAVARMQPGSDLNIPQASLAQVAKAKSSSASAPSSGSFGLAKVAHALLETFSSGVAQRNSQQAGGQDSMSARKAGSDESSAAASLASATSLLSDIMSGYSVASASEQQLQQHQNSQSSNEQVQTSSVSQQVHQSSGGQQQPGEQVHLSARSSEHSAEEQKQPQDGKQQQQQQHHQQQQQQLAPASPSSVGEQSGSSSSQAHVRKTRSIGLEYPIESEQQLQHKEQTSRAAQINNIVDFVSDSYTNNRLLFNFVMNQVGLSQAVPYVEQILASGNNERQNHW